MGIPTAGGFACCGADSRPARLLNCRPLRPFVAKPSQGRASVGRLFSTLDPRNLVESREWGPVAIHDSKGASVICGRSPTRAGQASRDHTAQHRPAANPPTHRTTSQRTAPIVAPPRPRCRAHPRPGDDAPDTHKRGDTGQHTPTFNMCAGVGTGDTRAWASGVSAAGVAERILVALEQFLPFVGGEEGDDSLRLAQRTVGGSLGAQLGGSALDLGPGLLGDGSVGGAIGGDGDVARVAGGRGSASSLAASRRRCSGGESCTKSQRLRGEGRRGGGEGPSRSALAQVFG